MTHILPVATRSSLQQFLFAQLPQFSRQALRTAALAGCCAVDGHVRPSSYKVQPGQTVVLTLAPEANRTILGENLRLQVVYEDHVLVVINKTPGMLVHPTARERGGTVANALLHRWAGLGIRPTFPHRLDRDTSGLLVVAKTPAAATSLALQFSRRQMAKRYLAIVSGYLPSRRRIYAPVGRHGGEVPPWQVRASGRPSFSALSPLEHRPGFTLVALEPVTGRTNQLRIHCAAIGHPIAGDLAYGGASGTGLCLHASSLTLEHPEGGALSVSAPPPPEFEQFWEKCPGEYGGI